MKKIISILGVFFLLSGCQVPIQFYLRNTSTHSTKIILFKTFKEKYLDSNVCFRYTNKSIPIKCDLYNSFKDTIIGIQKEESVILTIPPNSTVFLSIYDKYKYLIHNTDSISLYDEKRMKVVKKFPNRYSLYYDF